MGTDEEFRTSLRADSFGSVIVLTWLWKNEWNVSGLESLVGFNIYRAEIRGDFDFTTPHERILDFATTWIEMEVAGDEYYYMVIPVNGLGEEGSSTLAVGVRRVIYGSGYSDFALYLKPLDNMTVSGYLDELNLKGNDAMGAIFYFDVQTQQWVPHPSFIPAGIADPQFKLGEGNLIFLPRPKGYTFIGR